jgi:drug/metabolite transporter (DMT)-like permease
MLGAFFALLSAVTFGLSNASIRRGVLSGSVGQAMSINVPLGLVMFLVPVVLTGQLGGISDLAGEQWIYLSLAGISHFVWGRYWNYRAIMAMGSNLAGALFQVQLLISLALAMVFLDERMTVLKLFGIAFTLLGAALTLYGRGRRSPATSEGLQFTPDIFRGSLFGLFSAIGYGVSPIFVRAGLSMGSDGMVGGLASYLAAAGVVLMWMAVSPPMLREAFAIDRNAMRWFLVSGFAVNISQFFRYIALGIAPVIIVVPIIQLSGVFRFLISWFINRGHEVFDARTVVGLVVALLGAVLLALDADMIGDLLALPDPARDILRLTWP